MNGLGRASGSSDEVGLPELVPKSNREAENRGAAAMGESEVLINPEEERRIALPLVSFREGPALERTVSEPEIAVGMGSELEAASVDRAGTGSVSSASAKVGSEALLAMIVAGGEGMTASSTSAFTAV
jgi:hypothetical protein